MPYKACLRQLLTALTTALGPSALTLMEMMGRVLRAARLSLDLTGPELAKAANISLRSLNRVEADDLATAMRLTTAVKEVLEREGIKFLPATEQNGPGFLTPASGFIGPAVKLKLEAAQAAQDTQDVGIDDDSGG